MQPYLSVVVAARNDNYGGDFLYRMQLFVSTLGALANRHRLKAELLVVEWNPPPDRPRLRDAIDWPSESDLGVRIVTVPEDVHRGLPISDKMPMFEYMAKNVGIRRAHGEFILVTNPDIIFSDELTAFLARGNLPTDSYIEVDRYDIGKAPSLRAPVDKTLRFCSRNVVRIWTGEWAPVDPRFSTEVRRLVRSFASRPSPARLARWLWRRIKFSKNGNCPEGPEVKPAKVRLGAPGDFLLMARQQWRELRGFPELLSYRGIDFYMVCVASAAGLREVALPYRIYHQEHGRSEQALRPAIGVENMPGFREMLETKRPTIVNGDKWGLGDVALPEYEI
ncbi:MAG: hypothetical protein ABSH25_13040 [Syntrophorhabdales bacterium]